MLELNESNYEQAVVQKSHEVPVLVDFWADWCAPCKMLTPILEQLAVDYGEQLQIGKVNTDQERRLAEQHGIRSLPTLRLYRNGEVVEEVLGAQPESSLRALIEAHLVRASDSLLDQALTLAAASEYAQALQILDAAFNEDPDNPKLPLPLVRLYIQNRQLDKAAELLDSLPHDLRESDEGKNLQLLIEFATAAAAAPDKETLQRTLAEQPANAEASYQLAALQLLDGDYDAALEGFMDLLKKHRDFGDGAARRGLLAVFSLLGENDKRVGTYRRQMFALLH
jgi:putative thioredoxin